MNDEKLTEVLPMTRVPSSLRLRLNRIVAASVSKRRTVQGLLHSLAMIFPIVASAMVPWRE